jgi:CheY-like chemotaxis protein
MDEQTQRRATEPFFTTKGVGKGTGLGLSMASATLKRHGGVLQIESEKGNGTTITLLFPASRAEHLGAKSEGEQSAIDGLARDKATVLLVDDDDMVRTAAKSLLVALGCEVISADGGSSAIREYQARRDEVDLVMLDLAMPVMDGVECFNRLKEIDPNVCVLICTGQQNQDDVDEMLKNGAVGSLTKPFELEEAAKAIDAALHSGGRRAPAAAGGHKIEWEDHTGTL